MNLDGYIARIEAMRDPAALERIRAEALRDGELEDSDKQLLSGRIGMYLADSDRERLGRSGRTDYDIEDVPEEEA
jgi:hypothetical protein